MYYKAEVTKSIEDLWLNPETGEYEGCDPDTYRDLGIETTLTASNLEDLLKKIQSQYGRHLEHDIENRLMWSQEGEHHYSVPKEDRIPFIENYTTCIYIVGENEVSEVELKQALSQVLKGK